MTNTAPKAPVSRPVAAKPTAAQVQAPVVKPAAVAEVAAPAFKIETGIALPAIKRKSGKASMYPFDLLEKDQSFFVPATAEMANPAKTLASTVAAASSRFATAGTETRVNRKGATVPVMVKSREFVIRAVEEAGVKGARIFRTL